MERAARWIAKMKREKAHSFACNQDMEAVSAESERRELIYRFRTTERMENPMGVTHGGMIALALDWAMGVTTRVMLDQSDAPTINMQLSFLRPVPLNRDLMIGVRVRYRGSSVAHLWAEGWGEDRERPLVEATGVYYLRNRPLALD